MKSFLPQESRSCIHRWFLLLLVIFTQSITASLAQDSTRTVYFSFAYIKTKPGKEEAFREMLTNYSTTIFHSQVKEDIVLGWYIFQVLSPSGSQAEYNYVGITAVSNLTSLMEPVMPTNRQYLKKVFPRLDEKKITDIIAGYNDSREIVKKEIYTNYTVAVPVRMKPHTYAWWAFQQVAPGKLGESLKWEKDYWGPVHRSAIDMGGLSNWGVYVLQMPHSMNEQYQYITANFFEDLQQMQGNFKYDEALKKAFPNLDLDKIVQLPGGQKKVYRTELIKLVAYVNSSNVK